MDNNESGPPKASHEQLHEDPWLIEEARSTPDTPEDPELLDLIVNRETLFDELAADRDYDKYKFNKWQLKLVNQAIIERKQELGINPKTHPEVDPPATQE